MTGRIGFLAAIALAGGVACAAIGAGPREEKGVAVRKRPRLSSFTSPCTISPKVRRASSRSGAVRRLLPRW